MSNIFNFCQNHFFPLKRSIPIPYHIYQYFRKISSQKGERVRPEALPHPHKGRKLPTNKLFYTFVKYHFVILAGLKVFFLAIVVIKLSYKALNFTRIIQKTFFIPVRSSCFSRYFNDIKSISSAISINVT